MRSYLNDVHSEGGEANYKIDRVCTGIMSQIGAKSRDWGLGQAGAITTFRQHSLNVSKTWYIICSINNRKITKNPQKSSDII